MQMGERFLFNQHQHQQLMQKIINQTNRHVENSIAHSLTDPLRKLIHLFPNAYSS